MEEIIKYGIYVEGLVVLTRHFRMVLVLLTTIYQISTPFKSLDKVETVTQGAFREHEMTHHSLTRLQLVKKLPIPEARICPT